MSKEVEDAYVAGCMSKCADFGVDAIKLLGGDDSYTPGQVALQGLGGAALAAPGAAVGGAAGMMGGLYAGLPGAPNTAWDMGRGRNGIAGMPHRGKAGGGIRQVSGKAQLASPRYIHWLKTQAAGNNKIAVLTMLGLLAGGALGAGGGAAAGVKGVQALQKK